MDKILVVQTAFLGDVILTLPLVQSLKSIYPTVQVDMLVVPSAVELLQNHPSIHQVLVFDKRGRDSGLQGFLRTVKNIRNQKYQCAIVPHRSLRSAALVSLARIPKRIGFNKSAGWFFLHNVIRYDNSIHEVDRNMLLLGALGIKQTERVYPRLYPSKSDCRVVDQFMQDERFHDREMIIGIAPGTIWNTKRWFAERYSELSSKLIKDGFSVVLIGSKEDEVLCKDIQVAIDSGRVYNAAGKLTLLQSAELIRRCRVLISNDSAPMHIAVAVRTPVVAIFGATIPEFGFSPYGEHDIVVETKGLSCRPCSTHGGETCPIKTFDCMKNITAENVQRRVHELIKRKTSVNDDY